MREEAHKEKSGRVLEWSCLYPLDTVSSSMDVWQYTLWLLTQKLTQALVSRGFIGATFLGHHWLITHMTELFLPTLYHGGGAEIRWVEGISRNHLISIIHDHSGNSKCLEVTFTGAKDKDQTSLSLGQGPNLYYTQPCDMHFVFIISFNPHKSVSNYYYSHHLMRKQV